MKKLLTAIAAIGSLVALAGCEKTGHIPFNISAEAQQAFSAKYPSATNVEWENKNGYSVADFRSDNRDRSAWFDSFGSWYMTETEIRFSDLPQAVQNAFNASEYATWRVDDVDMLERQGVETVYVIEAETYQNGDDTSVDLYYSADGVLVRTVVDGAANNDYIDMISPSLNSSIEAFIESKYPGARIIDVEMENGAIGVEIIDGRTVRDLMFDASGNWLYTKTEISRNSVPATVMNALSASQYASYRIDDIDYYQTPDSEFYRFDLESADGDVKIDIAPDGSISVVTADSLHPGNSSGLSDSISEFIATNYPNATIREIDNEHGLIEVEIYHENREKTLYFNGSYQWVRTEWDVRRNDLPAAVVSTLNAQYGGYQIDDIEYVETPNGDYYEIELERGDREVTVRVAANGTIQ